MDSLGNSIFFSERKQKIALRDWKIFDGVDR